MAQRIPLWKLILARVLYRTWGARIAVDGCFVFLVSFPGSFHFYGEKAGAPWPIKTLFVGIVASDWLAYLSATMNVRKISYILIRKSFLPIKMKVITIYEIFRHWFHHWRAKSRQNNNIKYFSRFLPNRPRPLSSFDTHLRWQPVTQSARSRRSYGKIEDCEQSTRASVECRGDELLGRVRGHAPPGIL